MDYFLEKQIQGGFPSSGCQWPRWHLLTDSAVMLQACVSLESTLAAKKAYQVINSICIVPNRLLELCPLQLSAFIFRPKDLLSKLAISIGKSIWAAVAILTYDIVCEKFGSNMW